MQINGLYLKFEWLHLVFIWENIKGFKKTKPGYHSCICTWPLKKLDSLSWEALQIVREGEDTTKESSIYNLSYCWIPEECNVRPSGEGSTKATWKSHNYAQHAYFSCVIKYCHFRAGDIDPLMSTTSSTFITVGNRRQHAALVWGLVNSEESWDYYPKHVNFDLGIIIYTCVALMNLSRIYSQKT